MGGDGIDTVSYFTSEASVSVSLLTGKGSRGDAEGDVFLLDSIENLEGSDFDDLLVGDENDNRLEGNLGNDTLEGVAGNDFIYGGNDSDNLIGGEGFDKLFGEDGNDMLRGSNPDVFGSGSGEIDELSGGAGADTFVIGDTFEPYYLGAGYAWIRDFNGFEGDRILVHGSTSDYSLEAVGSSIDILYNDDVIASIDNALSLAVANALIVDVNKDDFFFAFSGNDSFTYTISDGTDTATEAVKFTFDANNPPGAVDDRAITIDFDADDLAAGTIITDQYEGISISSSTEFGAMLFDTNNITGGDFDLSATDLGNVLIISEDGDSTDPDDNAAGGTISIKFDQLARITSVGLLDIDEEGSSIAFFDDDSNLLEAVEIENLGDNSFQELAFDITDVARMEVHLAGSGALTGFDFILPSADPTLSQVSAFGDSLSDPSDIFNGTTSVEPF